MRARNFIYAQQTQNPTANAVRSLDSSVSSPKSGYTVFSFENVEKWNTFSIIINKKSMCRNQLFFLKSIVDTLTSLQIWSYHFDALIS